MAHTPYGYAIKNGRAVIDNEAANRVKELFTAYLSGLSLMDAAQQASIKRCHASIAKILTCRRYLGDWFYPTLIDADIFKQTEAERLRRARMLGRIHDPAVPKAVPVRIRFTMSSLEQLYEDPFAQAEYAYSLIESEVIMDAEP